MTDAASPARTCRRRRPSVALLLCLLSGPAFARDRAERPPPSCATPGTGWCVARRFAGTVARGELGFRFGEPLDVDGDGVADVAAGARFVLQGTYQAGETYVWSGASGALLRRWEGERSDGLFGHWVQLVPDVSGDGLADVVVAAPHATVGGRMHGVVVARSPRTGEELWKRAETTSENLGWDLALAGDHDGDGHPDLFVGAPSGDTGRVYLLSGKTGAVLRTYAPAADGGSFGWYVDRLDDLDGDGLPDLAVGAPFATTTDGGFTGGAWVLSSATGAELQHWRGADRRGGFGGVVAAVADADGDGKRDVAVGAPATEDQRRTLPGELWIYSTRTGRELRHWTGRQAGEQYGRMVVAAGDVDGDGVDDVAVGAPWYRRGTDDRAGRLELRSGRTGAVLTELFGDGTNSWFAWHVRRAPDPEHRGRPALLVGSLRHPAGDQPSAGIIDLLVLRRPSGGAPHGTTARGARRSDMR